MSAAGTPGPRLCGLSRRRPVCQSHIPSQTWGVSRLRGERVFFLFFFFLFWLPNYLQCLA